ncbi:MAG: MASE1 domain-containing protein [Arenimonas sp.]
MSSPKTKNDAASVRFLDGLPSFVWPLLSFVYAGVWLAFLQPSQVLWFLPAGLRLAVLWVLPAKRWAWLLLAEGLVACYLDWHTDDTLLDPDFIALSFVPLLVYAAAMYLVRGKDSGPDLNTPRNMLILLACGALSALMVSPVLSYFYEGKSFEVISFDPGTWGSIFAFVYGDLIGQLILAPLLILLFAADRTILRQPGLWISVLIAGIGTSVVLMLLHFHHELAPFLLLLVFAPMFLVAFQKSWKGAALSVALTGVLLEVYLHFNPLPLDLIVLQLAFALISCGSLVLGAAMSALRESHLNLQLQHRNVAQMNSQLLKASEELRHISQRLVRLEEQGQRELADELDVELGQSLHTLGTHLGMAVRSVKEQDTLKMLFSIRDKTREMEDSLRRVLRQLRPKALDNKGLKEAINNGPLHEVLDDAGIAMETHFDGPLSRLQEDEKTAIYRICQTIIRQAIGVSGLKKLVISVSVKEEQTKDCEVSLDIEFNPVNAERRQQQTAPLKAVLDRVLALDGEYEVSINGDSLLHRIVFRQTDAQAK